MNPPTNQVIMNQIIMNPGENQTAIDTPVLDDLKIVKVELFDVNAMERLASHDGISVDIKKQLKAYKRMRQNGNEVQIVYEYAKSMKHIKKGRMYPQRGLGLQTFPSDVRAVLAQPTHFDLDMENSQPVLLAQLCDKHGWKCEKLKEYVANRSSKLSEIMEILECDRDAAKNMCIAVMFGGVYKKAPLFIKDLTKELQEIGINIIRTYPDIFKLCLKEKSPQNSCVAHVIQDLEFNILQFIDKTLKSLGRSMDVYIHDGGLVRKLDGETHFPVDLLRLCETEVQTHFGFHITLSEKEMKHTFSFKTDVMRSMYVSEKEYQARKELFEENHFYCTETATVCCTDRHDLLVHISKTDASAYASPFNFQKTIDNKVRITEFIPEWIRDPMKRTIHKLIFYPDVAHEEPDSYNLFAGLEGSRPVEECKESQAIIDRWTLLVQQNAGKNEEMYQYMLKWFALSVQKPFAVPGVALVLINIAQGTGKDTLGEFHGSKVIGRSYYKNIKNVETELFDAHSTAFDKTLFLKLEEANGSLNRKFSDMLKAIITSTSVTINPKGMKKYTTEAFPHVMMTTNNPIPVKTEKGDRRFCISYTSSDYVGDRVFWDETHRLLGLPEAGHVIHEYLMRIDLHEFKPQDFPRSEYHKHLSDHEVSSEQLFITLCEPFTDLKGSQLHELYLEYCRIENKQPKNDVHFCRALAPMLELGIITKRTLRGCSVYTKKEKEEPTLVVTAKVVVPPSSKGWIVPKMIPLGLMDPNFTISK